MIRPPVPPVYFFILDASAQAVKSGMFQEACNVISHVIQSGALPDRTEVGFITYDHQIHVYNLKQGLSAPKMIVLGDIDDMLPIPVSQPVSHSSHHFLGSHAGEPRGLTGPGSTAATIVASHVREDHLSPDEPHQGH